MIIHLGISLKNNEVPNVFNRAILYVKTKSMEDTIMAGDLIFIDTSIEEYFPEDIISFRKPDQPNIIITHRIEVISGGLVTTKGDNNQISESWEINFSEDLIIGKYISKSSILGSVYEVLFVNSLDFLFVFIIIVFMLIGMIEIKNIVKLLSQKKSVEYEVEKQKMIEEEKAKLIEEMKDKE
jgi:signal peptidase I